MHCKCFSDVCTFNVWLQDCAFQLLTELLFMEGAFTAAAAGVGTDSSSSATAAAAAAAAAAARLVPSQALVEKMWRCGSNLLEREGPDLEDEEEDEDEQTDKGRDDLDVWDQEGGPG
jgi:hypothetical protein